jgi:hypothetical protein
VANKVADDFAMKRVHATYAKNSAATPTDSRGAGLGAISELPEDKDAGGFEYKTPRRRATEGRNSGTGGRALPGPVILLYR